jgi:hypothetical protein
MIREYLISQGWKPFENGFVDKWYERHVDLSEDLLGTQGFHRWRYRRRCHRTLY